MERQDPLRSISLADEVRMKCRRSFACNDVRSVSGSEEDFYHQKQVPRTGHKGRERGVYSGCWILGFPVVFLLYLYGIGEEIGLWTIQDMLLISVRGNINCGYGTREHTSISGDCPIVGVEWTWMDGLGDERGRRYASHRMSESDGREL